jgi:hypothetical protein
MKRRKRPSFFNSSQPVIDIGAVVLDVTGRQSDKIASGLENKAENGGRDRD